MADPTDPPDTAPASSEPPTSPEAVPVTPPSGPPKRGRGHPSNYTRERGDKIIAMVRAGVPASTAAAAAGVLVDTYYGWLRKGIADSEQGLKNQHVDFSMAVDQAMAEALAQAAVQLRLLGKKDFQALRYFLSSRDPENWPRANALSVSTPPDESMRVTVSLANSMEWVDLRTRIMAALEHYPEAKAAVLEALDRG